MNELVFKRYACLASFRSFLLHTQILELIGVYVEVLIEP